MEGFRQGLVLVGFGWGVVVEVVVEGACPLTERS